MYVETLSEVVLSLTSLHRKPVTLFDYAVKDLVHFHVYYNLNFLINNELMNSPRWCRRCPQYVFIFAVVSPAIIAM